MARLGFLLLGSLLLLEAVVGQDYDFDDKPQSLLKQRPSRLPSPRLGPKPGLKSASKTTTTTTEPPAYDEEEEYEDQGLDESPQTTTTSTEAPKKGFRGGVVRPFRSNEDLLEALKRRRQQASSGRSYQSPSTSSTTAAPSGPAEGLPSSRRSKSNGRYSQPRNAISSTPTSESTTEAPRPGRLFNRPRRF